VDAQVRNLDKRSEHDQQYHPDRRVSRVQDVTRATDSEIVSETLGEALTDLNQEISGAHFYDGHEVRKMSRIVCSTDVCKRKMNVKCWNRFIRSFSHPRGPLLAIPQHAECTPSSLNPRAQISAFNFPAPSIPMHSPFH
jgi:hypothetical protein